MAPVKIKHHESTRMIKKIKVKAVNFKKSTSRHLAILKGHPETVSMCSGQVSLKPGKSVGIHSTKQFEELIIILNGKGKVEIKGQKPLTVQTGMAVYNPPQTEHNIINTGTRLLRYIYIVAEAKKSRK